MVTRRDVVLGGALCITWCSVSCCYGQATRFSPAHGCVLSDEELNKIEDPREPIRVFFTGNEPVIPNSGNPAFDFALAQTLSRISSQFSVLPGFGYYDDYDGLNAFASPAVRMQKADGTVLFGKRLLARLLQNPESPDATVAAVCAHEFGHILQNKRGLMSGLRAGQPTVKRVELHADFLAGYFEIGRASCRERV